MASGTAYIAITITRAMQRVVWCTALWPHLSLRNHSSSKCGRRSGWGCELCKALYICVRGHWLMPSSFNLTDLCLNVHAEMARQSYCAEECIRSVGTRVRLSFCSAFLTIVTGLKSLRPWYVKWRCNSHALQKACRSVPLVRCTSQQQISGK